MEMTLGKRLRVTIFGESHGQGVGALVQGIPPGILIDEDIITQKFQTLVYDTVMETLRQSFKASGASVCRLL